MAVAITVLYPNASDATFNLEYYLAKHMPLVAERFAAHGFKGWRVVRMTDGPTGDKPSYSIAAILEFDRAEQFKAAIAAEGATVMGDVPNFSNMAPTILVGDVVGQG